jgi:hypothetical protein
MSFLIPSFLGNSVPEDQRGNIDNGGPGR